MCFQEIPTKSKLKDVLFKCTVTRTILRIHNALVQETFPWLKSFKHVFYIFSKSLFTYSGLRQELKIEIINMPKKISRLYNTFCKSKRVNKICKTHIVRNQPIYEFQTTSWKSKKKKKNLLVKILTNNIILCFNKEL